jgi:hypothetical protein
MLPLPQQLTAGDDPGGLLLAVDFRDKVRNIEGGGPPGASGGPPDR